MNLVLRKSRAGRAFPPLALRARLENVHDPTRQGLLQVDRRLRRAEDIWFVPPPGLTRRLQPHAPTSQSSLHTSRTSCSKAAEGRFISMSYSNKTLDRRFEMREHLGVVVGDGSLAEESAKRIPAPVVNHVMVCVAEARCFVSSVIAAARASSAESWWVRAHRSCSSWRSWREPLSQAPAKGAARADQGGEDAQGELHNEHVSAPPGRRPQEPDFTSSLLSMRTRARSPGPESLGACSAG